MKKIVKAFVTAMVLTVLANTLCFAAEVIMYDFTDTDLGWSLVNASNTAFDGESISFTAAASNPVMGKYFANGAVALCDYRYIAVRAKTQTASGTPVVKPYIQLADKDGNKIGDVWSCGLTDQSMSKDGYKTHIFDIYELKDARSSYLQTINIGVGLYCTGNKSYVDFIALYPENALYKTVSYDKNTTDTITGMPENAKVLTGSDYTPEKTDFIEREGWYIAGWSLDKQSADTVSVLKNVTEDTVLYAVWKKDERVTLNYEPNAMGQTVTYLPKFRSVKYNAGEKVTLPEKSPERDGFEFDGWSKTPDGSQKVTDGFTIDSDTTLYACWSTGGGYFWDFTDGSLCGWTKPYNAQSDFTENGLEITSTTNDPQFQISGVSIPTSVNKKVNVVCDVVLPDGTQRAGLSVYVGLDGKSPTASTIQRVTAVDGMNEYVFDFSSKDFWNNADLCTLLRFDPTEIAGAKVTVSRIYVQSAADAVYFNANGAEGYMSPQTASDGYTLPECTYKKDGFEFVCYTDGVNEYYPGDAFVAAVPVTLYAKWRSLGGLDAKCEIFYPGYAKKALILSYDDGTLSSDEKLIKRLNAAGFKAAFNLIAKKALSADPEKLKSVYAGHEIASHTYSHFDMRAGSSNPVSDEDCVYELSQSKKVLEEIFGTEITGLAWSITNPKRECTNKAAKQNYLYARNAPTVGSLKEFSVPESFCPSWDFTAVDYHDGVDYCVPYIDKYLSLDSCELTLLSIWGHPWNVDGADRWYVVDNMISDIKMSAQNIWNPTVSEYVKYINASRKLVKTADALYNPTDVDITMLIDEKPYILPANSYYDGKNTYALGTFENSDGICKTVFSVDFGNTSGALDKAFALAACYDENSRLCGVKKIQPADSENGIFRADIPITSKAAVCKVFMFSDESTLSPLGAVITLNER